MEIKLELNVTEAFKDASIEETEKALSEYTDVRRKIETAEQELRTMLANKKSEKTRERFSEINDGDRVSVTYLYAPYYKGGVEKTLDGVFYAGITNTAKESVYMTLRNGPYANFALAKKDGTMGKRFRSFKVDEVISIKKV